MRKIGTVARSWLKSFHILFTSVWIGSALSAAVIPLSAANAADGGTLAAYYEAVEALDVVVIPAAVLSFWSGVFLAWQSSWGFFKHFFVMASLVVAIAAIVVGLVVLSPGKEELFSLAATQGLAALDNPDYQATWTSVIAVSLVQVFFLVFTAFVSVLKPRFRKAPPR